MLLSRLRIRGKLTLLVIIPLLAMAGLTVPVVRDLIAGANEATEIDDAATVAGRIGALLQDIQRERLLSIGFLLDVVSEDELALQTAAVTDRIVDIRGDLDDRLPAEVRAELDDAARLSVVRNLVGLRSITPQRVLDDYTPLLDGLIESLRLVDNADAETPAGRQLIALDALLRMDESNAESVAVLAVMAGGDLGRLPVRYLEERAAFSTYLARFKNFATTSQRGLYQLVEAALRQRLGADFEVRFETDPARTMTARPIASLFPALQSFTVVGGFVEKSLVDDVTALVGEQRQRQLTIAYGIGALALAVLLLVLILVAAVARAVAVPLTRLSRSAALVADAGETELQRVADDEAETVEPVHLEVLEVNSRDEIGDLARVFERVQSTASQLVERQVLSRRNVAEMFGHIGRRTQNLVGGQVSLIDELENEETNPDRLAKLYRLDHISNRLRRSADSLVVISGAEREESHSQPARLVDVVRLALAEIEEYTRVDVEVPLDLSVPPALVSDMVLICAELLENATSYSPPHTRVNVSARGLRGGGAQLVVTDHGIGMPDERLTEENSRIARRERLDLVPSQVLGLFVVGRLARRHGLSVALSHTDGGGVTVDVHIGVTSAPRENEPSFSLPSVSEPPPQVRRVPAAPVTPTEKERSFSLPEPAGPSEIVLTPYYPVPEPYHPAPEHRPSTPGLWPTEREAVSRVSDLMRRDELPWNAFEIVPHLPAAPPSLEAPPPAPPMTPLPAAPVAPLPAAPVARPPATPAVRPSATPAVRPSATPVVQPPATPAARPQAAPVPPPRPASETQSLSRRVPGASLSSADAAPPRPTTSPIGEQDPDAARSLVEQFESGVARALHDVSHRNNQ